MYDKEFLNPLLFFLQESTPFYIPLRKVTDDNEAVVELYEKVCRNALLIVCRLITNRESDKEFMSKEKQADIIYKNFVISIPMIFDMVALYGYNNKNLIQKIIDTLLKIEPRYSNDLKMGIKFIQSTFETMRKQLETTESENRELFEKYEDLSLYLMNIATTLNLVVDLVPNDVKAYCSRDLRLEQSIASLYDNFIPQLYQFSHSFDSEAWFLAYINYARVELIKCFRSLLNRGISAILNAGSDKNRQKFADGVLSTLTECAGYKIFIADYIRLFPIELDLDVIMQSGKNM
jgi:activating signal cointegrator complex subunit 2